MQGQLVQVNGVVKHWAKNVFILNWYQHSSITAVYFKREQQQPWFYIPDMQCGAAVRYSCHEQVSLGRCWKSGWFRKKYLVGGCFFFFFFCHLSINIEIEDSRLGGKVLIFMECQRPPNDSTPLRSRDKQIWNWKEKRRSTDTPL